MNRVFLDASFWVTYRDEDEARHADAIRVMAGLFRQRAQFVTTLAVLCEIHANFSRNRLKRALVLEDLWNNPLVTVEEISHQDQTEAIELLRDHHDKSYSLCDALSLVVMRRLGAKRVVTFDNHFKQFGAFEVIS